jgi:hypothetical protein
MTPPFQESKSPLRHLFLAGLLLLAALLAARPARAAVTVTNAVLSFSADDQTRIYINGNLLNGTYYTCAGSCYDSVTSVTFTAAQLAWFTPCNVIAAEDYDFAGGQGFFAYSLTITFSDGSTVTQISDGTYALEFYLGNHANTNPATPWTSPSLSFPGGAWTTYAYVPSGAWFPPYVVDPATCDSGAVTPNGGFSWADCALTKYDSFAYRQLFALPKLGACTLPTPTPTITPACSAGDSVVNLFMASSGFSGNWSDSTGLDSCADLSEAREKGNQTEWWHGTASGLSGYTINRVTLHAYWWGATTNGGGPVNLNYDYGTAGGTTGVGPGTWSNPLENNPQLASTILNPAGGWTWAKIDNFTLKLNAGSTASVNAWVSCAWIEVCYTAASSPTPTFTPTKSRTPSPTPSPSPSATPSFTFSPTRTPTPSATPTASPTKTFTVTSTYTATPTNSPSPSPTPTFTATSTRTVTPTNSPTPSPTPTFTATSTRTVTPTNSPTPSPTSTFTATLTRTETPSYTVTPSPTPTYTATSTRTATPSFTGTPSPTPTFTFTVTFTDSPTPTPVSSATPTYSATSTKTATASSTVTLTVQGSATDTLTRSPTPSFSDSPSATPSTTATSTKTATPTPTDSPNSTATSTPSASPTSTATPTSTPSFSATRSASPTATRSASPTAGATLTFSPSPTPSAPLSASIKVYNGAGELVAVLETSLGLFTLPSNITVIDGVFDPDLGGKGTLQMDGPGTTVAWNGKASGGGMVASGSYFVVTQVQDSFGKLSTWTTPLTVLRTPSGAEVEVYNSAGELVWHASKAVSSGGAMQVSDTHLVAGAPAGIKISFGSGPADYVVWNGTNGAGAQVSQGNYLVKITQRSGSGAVSTYSQGVVVLRDNAEAFESVLAAPNPARGPQPELRVSFQGAAPGQEAWGEVYNMAGERVGALRGDTTAGLAWRVPLELADGVFLLRAGAISPQGRKSSKILKVVILR